MRYFRLALSLALFTPAFAFFGFAAAHDSGGRLWIGTIVGGLVGVFFGLVFGGAKGRWLDVFYPPAPKQQSESDEETAQVDP
jgi:hypothetical protein